MSAAPDYMAKFQSLQNDKAGFLLLSEILKNKAGINLPLNEKNLSLMASRMNSLMAEYQIHSYKELAKAIESGNSKLEHDFTCALTTNTTQFFREDKHFDFLKTELPAFLKKRAAQHKFEIKVWVAATSTGQETYSLLMTLLEGIGADNRFQISVLSTDIDDEVLEKASTGTYVENEMRGVPDYLKQKYFQKSGPIGNASSWTVKDSVRALVRYRTLNLVGPVYPSIKSFDIVFCRNVLIYFDYATQKAVVNRLVETLNVDGFLFLGHSETATMKNDKCESLISAVYKRIK